MVNAESKTATETCNRGLDVKLGVKNLWFKGLSKLYCKDHKKYSRLINFELSKFMVTATIMTDDVNFIQSAIPV